MQELNSSYRISREFVARISAAVRLYYLREFGEDHSAIAIERSLERWLDRHFDLFVETAAELLTTPGRDEAIEFARILHEMEGETQAAAVPEAVAEIAAHPVFNGNRPFSPVRLAAMMGYLGTKGKQLYKTKLNKLLFYADLTGYYLTGRGISGARYVHLPYGPVPDTYENVLSLAEAADNIRVTEMPDVGAGARLISAGVKPFSDELSENDKRILDWVADTYGDLTASEITEVSHKEMAYKNTRPGESIAYRYADFLHTLPPKDLLYRNS